MDCVRFERNPGRHNKVSESAYKGQSEKHVTFRTERGKGEISNLFGGVD